MLNKYIHHNLILLVIFLISFALYLFSSSSVAKNLSVLFALAMFFIVNVFYHFKHTKAHTQIIAEYLLISTLVYLIYLIIVLY